MFQITVLFCYTAAGVWLLRRTEGPRAGALGLLAVALATHAWALFAATGRDGVKFSIGETASLIGLIAGLAAVAFALRRGQRGLSGVIALLAGLLSMGGLAGTELGPTAAGGGWTMASHVAFSIVAYGLLTVGAVVAVTLALKERSVRAGRVDGWGRLLPPLETMESDLFAAIGAGFAVLSLAIFSGMIFVRDLGAQHLTHKTVLTFVSWALFGALLLGRWRFGWRGPTAVKLTLASFGVLLLAYFGSRIVLEVILGRQWG